MIDSDLIGVDHGERMRTGGTGEAREVYCGLKPWKIRLGCAVYVEQHYFERASTSFYS